MENNIEKLPTAEQLVENKIIEKRKKSLKKVFGSWIKDEHDKLFIIILLATFIFRILIYLKTNEQAIWWDAADYLSTAKRWAGLNPNMIDIWYYRRGFLWAFLSSLIFRIGLGELTIRFLIVLFSTGIVFVSYFLIKEMFDKRLALLVSIGTSMSWVYIFFSGRPLTNIPATFFLLTAVLFFWKGYVKKQNKKFIYFFGLFFALSCMTRMQYSMFTLPLIILVFTKEKFKFLKNKHLWIAVLIFLILFIPHFVLHYQHFGNPIFDILNYYFGVEGISESGEVGGVGDSSKLLVYFTNLPYLLDANSAGYSSLWVISPLYILFIIGFLIFFLDLFLGFDKIFSNSNIQKKFFILTWIVSAFIILGRIAPHLEQRYVMQTLPFLYLIALYPSKILYNFLRKNLKFKNISITIILILITLFLFMPNYNFGTDLIDQKKASFAEVRAAGEWMKSNSNPEDIIITASTPQNAYYSERATYNFYLGPKRGMPKKNETDFYEFIDKEKPKYLVLSVYESRAHQIYNWATKYPENFPERVRPVQIYKQGEQPVLAIYEFIYS